LQFKVRLGKEFVRPYLKKTLHKKRAGGVAQGIGSEFKLQYKKKTKEKEKQKLGHLHGFKACAIAQRSVLRRTELKLYI
jgi:hypothetical protein